MSAASELDKRLFHEIYERRRVCAFLATFHLQFKLFYIITLIIWCGGKQTLRLFVSLMNYNAKAGFNFSGSRLQPKCKKCS